MDKRRKKKQKEQAEDEAFLDNEQDDGEYEQAKSGQPSVPAFACLLVPAPLNNTNFALLLTAAAARLCHKITVYILSCTFGAIPSHFADCAM